MKKFLFFILVSVATFSTSKTQAQPSSSVLELIGGTSAVMMYNTYVAIGSYADMYTGEVIQSAKAKQLVGEQIEFMKTMKEYLAKAANDKSNKMAPDDVYFLEQVGVAVNLLMKQAQALDKFLDTGAEADALKFDNNRVAAWNKIAELLKLE